MKYGYCAVGGALLGIETVESLQKEGSKALKKIGMDKIEYSRLIQNSDDCVEAGRFFHQEQVDAIIINFAGWLGGGDLLRLARELENIPMLLWSFGKGPTLTLTCLMEATSDFTKTGKRFFTIIGAPGDAGTLEDITRILRAIDAFKFTQRANIGFIGYACPGMVDVSVDEISLRRKIGCELVHLDLIELVQEYQKIPVKAASSLAGELKTKAGKITVDDTELSESSRLYLALRTITERYKLNAFTIRCWPELRDAQYNFHVTPCYALSRLTDEGVIGVCESDVSSAVTMLLLHRLTGRAPVTLDYTTINIDRNSLGFWHCGPHALSLAGSSKEVRVAPPPIGGSEEWGGSCALEFSIKEGKATFAKLTREYDKMSITSGTFVKPEPVMRGGVGEAVMDTDARSYLQRIIQEGFEHHICAAHGDVRRELLEVCRLAEFKPEVF